MIGEVLQSLREAVQGLGLGGRGLGGVLDLILLGGIGLGIVRGYMRGGIEQIGSLAGLILGVWMGLVNAESGAALVREYVSASIPPEVETQIGFIVVYIGTQILTQGATITIGHVAGLVGMEAPNRLLGGVVGGVKSMVVASALLMVGGQIGLPNAQTKAESLWYEPVRKTLPKTWAVARNVFPGIGSLSSVPDRLMGTATKVATGKEVRYDEGVDIEVERPFSVHQKGQNVLKGGLGIVGEALRAAEGPVEDALPKWFETNSQ